MVSIIITAYKEPTTIVRCLESILDPAYRNLPEGECEVMLVCPDEETRTAGFEKAADLKTTLVHIRDPQKGKPHALNLAFAKAKGDLLILTDGDVYLGKGAVPALIKKLESNSETGGISGRPVSADEKNNMFAYFGHLLVEAAHHKRSNSTFFPMSGYLMAIRKPNFSLPEKVLTDDAFISYMIKKNGYSIGYEPQAEVFVRFPRNFHDWYNQKARSVGGYIQLVQMEIIESTEQSRSIGKELRYFWFPFGFAKNIRQFWWSLVLYPMRLFLWLRIFYERKILHKDFTKTWVRIESTK